MRRNLLTVPLLSGALLACGGPPPESESPAPESNAAPEGLARTADPFRRGLTEADFPRIRELAPGVYSYEQLRAAGEELFTTVSMFVVTEEGVLVADGQGSPEETARLVEEIGKITPQPITHVVVCSDHGTTPPATPRSPRARSSSSTRTRSRRCAPSPGASPTSRSPGPWCGTAST